MHVLEVCTIMTLSHRSRKLQPAQNDEILARSHSAEITNSKIVFTIQPRVHFITVDERGDIKLADIFVESFLLMLSIKIKYKNPIMS